MIPAETISKIKDEADIIEVLSDFITLKKAGSNYKANCPFHNEKTPSFVVSPAKGIYKCFGCGRAGDSVKFVMEHEQMNYPEALKYLASKYNIEIVEERLSDEQQEAQSLRDSLYIVNAFARDTFQEQLFESEEGRSIGLSYFKERGFNESVIKKFQLGYALEERDALSKLAIEKGYQAELLKKAGLMSNKEDVQLDFFRGRVMFPIHSVSGKVLGFGGRTLKSNSKLPKYINTPESEIYDKSSVLYGMYFARNEIRKLGECLLVEGYTDVISMHQAGVENVVASSGTSLTNGQVRLIKRYAENVTVLYDGDNAGMKAAIRGIDILLENGLNARVCMLPEEHDPDSFVREKGLTGFQQFLQDNTRDFLLFKSEFLRNQSGNDPGAKAANIKDLVASIALIDDTIKRTLYIKECAGLMDLPEQVLATEVNKHRSRDQRKKRQEAEREYEPDLSAPSIENEQLVEAGINLEFYERNVIRALLEHGPRPYDEQKTTARYILEELEGVPFENQTYNAIRAIANGINEERGVKEILHNEDESISSLAISLMTSPYELSENWQKKHKISLPDPEITYKEDVDSELYWLKFWKLKVLEIQLMERIESAEEDQLPLLLKMKLRLDKQKTELAALKGVKLTGR